MLVVSLLALLATVPPGTPKPGTGAPADKPGRNDPFGTQGGKADEEKTQAEELSRDVRPRISRIHIEGNDRTPDDHIRSHLMLHENDPLDEGKVKLSRARLLQLGAFDDVDAEVLPDEGADSVTLVLKVKEKNRFFITDTLYGSTQSTKFYAGLGLAVADVFNTGLSVAATAVGGSGNRWAGRLALYFPDLNVHGISFVTGLQVIGQRNRENACGSADCWRGGNWLDYSRLGGEADFGFRIGKYQRFLFGYRAEWLDTWQSGEAPAQAFALPGRSYLSALVLGFDRDARNETFLPTRGERVQAEVTISTRALLSRYEYTRFIAQYEQWVPQGGGRAWRLDFAAGLVQGDAPFFERFYAADWSYFALGAATPRLLDMNFSPDPRYDSVLALVGTEYDFPLWHAEHFFLKRGYLAVGGRFLYTSLTPGGPRTPVSKIPFSADASVRVESPLGVLSVSLGYLLDLFF